MTHSYDDRLCPIPRIEATAGQAILALILESAAIQLGRAGGDPAIRGIDRMSREAPVQCYAVGILWQVRLGPPVVEYLQRIDETLAPFGGHFIVHGGMTEVLEGTPAGLKGRGGRTRGVGCAP